METTNLKQNKGIPSLDDMESLFVNNAGMDTIRAHINRGYEYNVKTHTITIRFQARSKRH